MELRRLGCGEFSLFLRVGSPRHAQRRKPSDTLTGQLSSCCQLLLASPRAHLVLSQRPLAVRSGSFSVFIAIIYLVLAQAG